MQINIHDKFQLNGISFSSSVELLKYAEQNSPSIYPFLGHFLSDANEINVQTSGSTGTPKVIAIRKEFMVQSAMATGKFFNLSENTTALLCLNPDYIAGKMMLVRALILGWKLDVVPQSSKPLKQINKSYDFSAMVPMQVYNSIDELHKIKTLIVGGGVVSQELQSKLQALKTNVFATYGMTETVTHIAVKRLNGKDEKSLYRTLPNVKIATDERNCLIIDASKVSVDKVVTNDIVKIISDNEFEWLGRYDSIINSGGIKLIPEQIELKLSEVIKNRFFISSLPDEKLGEKLILIIEGKENTHILDEVKNLQSLDKYEVPKAIYFLPSFIETATKKIQRKKTRDLIFG